MRLSNRMQMLCLAVLVLAIYYISISATVNPVDDNALIQWLNNNENLSLRDIFSWTTGSYYRPLLQSSFLFDMKIWGASSSFMHLENVLLHLLNTLLLFVCAGIINRNVEPRLSWPPFVVAFLFAVHPINTEAVNWISGRSDLLACSFVLLATIILLRGMELRRPIYTYLSLLPIIPGLLCKETTAFFLPAAVILVVSDDIFLTDSSGIFWQRIRLRIAYLVPYLILPVIYLLLRAIWLSSSAFGLQPLARLIAERGLTVGDSLALLISGIGFYVKKIVYPWPLNFTIAQLPEYSFVAGLCVLPLLCYCLWRLTFIKGLYLAAFSIGLSALMVLLLRPAWTPLAERYLYVPAAFFCLALVFTCAIRLDPLLRHWAGTTIILVVCALMTFSTVQRNLLWQDNLHFFADAVKKSPNFPFVRSVYADLLIQAGHVEEGAAIIRTNTAAEGVRNADFLDLKRAKLLYNEGRYLQAKKLILKTRRKDSPLYYLFQNLLADVDTKLLGMISGEPQRELLDETVKVLLELRKTYQEPLYYYRVAKLYLSYGEKQKAAEFFHLAAEQSPEGTHYKVAAAALAEKLSRQ